MRNRIFGFIIMTAALFVGANQASASLIELHGSGTRNADPSTTFLTAPGKSWSFDFLLPTTISANPTTEATGFHFFLDGIGVAETLTSVRFFDISNLGMFTI